MYLAGDRRTAYAETLAVARVGKEFRDAVAFAADQFGVPVEDVLANPGFTVTLFSSDGDRRGAP
ncbi:hypothetical protein [Arthrobacter globiformis]|uniref:hypothetical protein n=1 Tax=Arthrobacter globiformis TaxID=1665 RepID=UPI0027D79AFA|nr:hypothetical protein [Arthrobacter globiformis]